MAHPKAEITFGDLEMDERYKKLERSLKLAVLKRECNKNVHNRGVAPLPTWPSISSINGDALDSSYVTPSLHSRIGSDVLASSINLRNVLLKQKYHNTNQEVLAISDMKHYNSNQDNHIDRCIMPPPKLDKVYRTSKKIQDSALLNREILASTPHDNLIQSSVTNFSFRNTPSCLSVNTDNSKDFFVMPMTSNESQKIDRVFSKWRVILNDQNQLIIKGTLECGKVARSKPIIRRYTATYIESIYKHKYSLQGNIIDDRNELPNYVRGKFYNGFPDDWENVYQIWRTFVSEGSLPTFRWPTPITDSDDDLKSELTDTTYIRVTDNKDNTVMRSYDSIKSDERLIKSGSPIKKLSEKEKSPSNHNLQNYEKNCSFVKSFIPNTEKSMISTIKETNHEDKMYNVKADIPCSSGRINRLNLQEDKLNIIINNLADRNCSPKYIDKIIEMFNCLDYVMSYNAGLECIDSVAPSNQETSQSEMIPVQHNIIYNKETYINANKVENTKPMSYTNMHSSDLGYGSIKNNSNRTQLSNARNSVEPKYDAREELDKSESETYTGVPKISIERVLQAKEASGKILKRKMRKKIIQLNTQKYVTSPQHNENATNKLVAHAAIPITHDEKNLSVDESCIITEDKVEMLNASVKEHHKATNINKKLQENFYSHQESQKNNLHNYRANTTSNIMHMQSEQLNNAFETQKFKSNSPVKEQKISYKIRKNIHLHDVADVDYTTSSDVEKNVAVTNLQKTNRNAKIISHVNLDQDTMIINSENNINVPDKPHISQGLYKKFVEQSENKIAKIKSDKPVIISSVPVNLSLRICNINSQKSAQTHDSDISIVENEDKQCVNTQPIEKAYKKKRSAINAKSIIIAKDSHSKTINNQYQTENHATLNVQNDKIESNVTSPVNSMKIMMNPTTQSKNRENMERKHGENNPKVLTAWMPKVVYNSKSKNGLGLTFQGKLLNEAGHVVHRKFTTDIIHKRLSATLIETVNYEVYQLFGCLNDNKHVIPKELAKQCRNGCPAKIEQFCLTWKSLLHGRIENVGEKFHNTSMDSLSVPVSSRGRHILPPLSYWTGERVTLKDNIPVYNLGSTQESSLVSLGESPSKSTEKKKKQRKKETKMDSKNTSSSNVNRQKSLLETNEVSNTNKNQMIVIEKAQSINKSSKTKAENNTKKSDNIKESRKAAINSKRRIAQQLQFSSTDETSEEEQRMRHIQSNTNVGMETPTEYITKLRKRQKIETSSKISHKGAVKLKNDAICPPPTRRTEHNIAYAYYRNIPLPEDFLSEDPVSPI